MVAPNLIPTLDPNPLPAPYWLCKFLLVVTFFLHIVAMNLMLGGGVLALAAKWRPRTSDLGNRLLLDVARKVPSLLAATITLLATMVQFLVGIGFVISLPPDLRLLFFGGDPWATTLLIVSMAAAMGAIYVVAEALRTQNIRLAGRYATGLTAAVILSMSVIRDLLRDAYLKLDFHPQQFAAATQWSVLPLFLALFIAGAILWFVMLKRYGFFAGHRAEG